MRLRPALHLLLGVSAATDAPAHGRIPTRIMTCAARKALVDRNGSAVPAASDIACEQVHRDGGACRRDETGAPAYETSADVKACFAGWRC